MPSTRNDLPEKTRRKVIALLQPALAEATDLATHAKQAHWNVRGPQFFALHQLFDQVYTNASAHVDELAERIVQLGGTARGTARAAAAESRLPAFPEDATAAGDLTEALARSLAGFGKRVRAAIDEATKLGDADTADLFTGMSRATDKDLWMVEAHL